MKKKTSDYSLLCIVGIFVCLVFIILPPVFRKVFPKQETVVLETDYRQLTCSTSDSSEIIVVNYKGEDARIGQLKYTYSLNAETLRASLLKTDMERSYNLAKQESTSNDVNKMTYIISPTSDGAGNVIDSSDLQILSIELKQLPDNQKLYYEKLGFSCTITDL